MTTTKPKDVNIQPVGFRIPRVLTVYAQKLPRPALTSTMRTYSWNATTDVYILMLDIHY